MTCKKRKKTIEMIGTAHQPSGECKRKNREKNQHPFEQNKSDKTET